MICVVPIVEGDGEVQAVPVLLRRMAQWLTPESAVDFGRPIRVRRDRFLRKDEEFRRMLLLAAAKAGDAGWILVLLDADDDCPVDLARDVVHRATGVVPHCLVSVVCANREFEAWFLASAESLNGRRGLQVETNDRPLSPDAIRGAKEWLSHRMLGGRYRETTDQPAFAAVMNLDLAASRSRSFRKMCTDWSRFVALATQ
jgi:Domain of unknown function (DUF4276)